MYGAIIGIRIGLRIYLTSRQFKHGFDYKFHYSSMDFIMNSSERATVHIFRYQLFFTSLTHFILYIYVCVFTRSESYYRGYYYTMLQLAHGYMKLCIYRSTFPTIRVMRYASMSADTFTLH